MYQTGALDLAFALATIIIAYRLFLSYRPSVTPLLWVFWAGQMATTGQAGLALAGVVAVAVVGAITFWQAPRHVIQYGPWAGYDAPMLSRWQLAGLSDNAQVVSVRGLISEVFSLERNHTIYRHPHRIFYTTMALYDPAAPPPLATMKRISERVPYEDVSVDWSYLARGLAVTAACALLFVGVFFAHIVVAILLVALAACLLAILGMFLAVIGVILQDALYEDRDEDQYPYYPC